jgi:hypothetical protein
MRTTAALLLLLAAGCGLEDYQARMLDAQARADRADAEAGKLDEPLTLQVQGAPDLYVRPPRGIRPSPEDNPKNGFIYRFPRRDPNDKPAVTDLFVAVAVGRPDFPAEALYSKEAGVPRLREVSPPGRPALAFDVYQYDASSDFALVTCVLRDAPGDLQLALTYRVDKARLEKEVEPLTPCLPSLESLAVGPEAAKARQAYARYKTRPRQAPGG